jgi:hypothetical protein
MGEARHAANYTANQGDYNGAYTLLKNGLQGNAEVDVSFRRAEHLRRPFRRIRLPSDRLRNAG